MRALLVGLAVLAVCPTPAEAEASPFARELEARRRRFEAEGDRPAALVPLLGVLDLWELLGDRQPLVDFLEVAQASARVHPEVRARAAYLSALLLDRLGRREEADRRRRALGLVSDFWV